MITKINLNHTCDADAFTGEAGENDDAFSNNSSNYEIEAAVQSLERSVEGDEIPTDGRYDSSEMSPPVEEIESDAGNSSSVPINDDTSLNATIAQRKDNGNFYSNLYIN